MGDHGGVKWCIVGNERECQNRWWHSRWSNAGDQETFRPTNDPWRRALCNDHQGACLWPLLTRFMEVLLTSSLLARFMKDFIRKVSVDLIFYTCVSHRFLEYSCAQIFVDKHILVSSEAAVGSWSYLIQIAEMSLHLTCILPKLCKLSNLSLSLNLKSELLLELTSCMRHFISNDNSGI